MEKFSKVLPATKAAKFMQVVAALLVGGLLVGLPYALARGITNRLVQRRYQAGVAAKAHA